MSLKKSNKDTNKNRDCYWSPIERQILKDIYSKNNNTFARKLAPVYDQLIAPYNKKNKTLYRR